MSSVRLRIVINSHNGVSVRSLRHQARVDTWRSIAARTGAMTLDELARMWDELVVLLRRVWEELTARTRGGLAGFSRFARETFCGLRGHDDRLLAERRHLALSCGRCGRETSGWDLPESSRSYAAPSRHHQPVAGPRYLEVVRRRS
jgi:hypothetical protein